MKLKEIFPGIPRRIADRVSEVESGCWVWSGWHNDVGYGYTSWDGRDRPVHRLFMEWLGRVEDGEDVHHTCENPGCCNPAHLVGMSRKEHSQHSHRANKMACKYGHDWSDPHNVYTRPDGRRYCAECNRIQSRRRNAAA